MSTIHHTKYFTAQLFLLLLILLIASPNFAQKAPGIEWQKCYGGAGTDGFSVLSQRTFIRTFDKGFAFEGETASNDGDVHGNHGGSSDVWVVKLNETGIIEWQKCLGGSGREECSCLIQTSDHGYVIVAYLDYSFSNDGDLAEMQNTGNNIWVVKLDSSGQIEWKRILGGGVGFNGSAMAYSVIESKDSGYVIAGTEGTSGEGFSNHGRGDAYIVKLNSSGSLLWQHCFGGSENDDAKSIVQTADGGYVFAGNTQSNDGDVSGNHFDSSLSQNSSDVWMVKLDAQGLVMRQQCFGGKATDELFSMVKTSDGGYALAAGSDSRDGDLTGVPFASGFWIVKLDSMFRIVWQRRLNGTGTKSYLTSIAQTLEGGFVLGGWGYISDSGSVGFHHNGLHGDSTSDLWAAKLSPSGSVEWQRYFGGYSNEGGSSIVQTQDSGFVIAGETTSNDGDVSGNHGSGDIWILKFGGLLNSVNSSLDNNSGSDHIPYQIFKIYPNPSSDVVHLQLYATQTMKQVKFYDMVGRELTPSFNLTANIATVDVNNLLNGAYFVRVTFSYQNYSGTYSLPLIVQH